MHVCFQGCGSRRDVLKLPTAEAGWVCIAALPGAGRRVGENMEQAWAQARPVMKLTRYMTKEGYVTGLDDIFLQMADDKLLEFVQSLVSADKACRKKLGKCGRNPPPRLHILQ